MNHSLHYYLHDLYGYLGFFFRIPLHLHHKAPTDLLGKIFTIRGALVCGCGYVYDRGYYLMSCQKCYEEENRLWQKKVASLK